MDELFFHYNQEMTIMLLRRSDGLGLAAKRNERHDVKEFARRSLNIVSSFMITYSHTYTHIHSLFGVILLSENVSHQVSMIRENVIDPTQEHLSIIAAAVVVVVGRKQKFLIYDLRFTFDGCG